MIRIDESLFRWINGFAGNQPWLDNVLVLLAGDFFLPVVIAAVAWSIWFLGRDATERLRHQVGFIYAAFGAGLVNSLLAVFDNFFFRARPFLALDQVTVLFYRPTDSSFPSNAAAFAFAMAAGVWMVHRRMGIIIGIAAAVFSAARVYCGMHYPMDILGGALLGVLSSLLMARFLGLIQPFIHLLYRIARRFYVA